MNFDKFKAYLKVSYKGYIVSFIIAILWFAFDKHDLFWLIYFPFSIIQGYYRYQQSLVETARLKAKGLTEEDIENIRFVKHWEHARKRGMWDYCIINGGFLYGLAISIVTSTIMLLCTGKDMRDGMEVFGGMFSFIGYNYIIGATIGVIIFRRIWKHNERRFLNLTDPLAGNYLAADFKDL